MVLTPAQKLVITGYLSAWDIRIDSLVKGMDFALERMRKLGGYGLYIEHIILDAQMVEHTIKLLVKGYASKGEILKALGENSPYESLGLYKVDEDTLGDLLGRLKSLHVDHSLISKLSRLNGVRKEMIHHLFDGNRDIEKADRDAKAYIGTELAPLIQEVKAAVKKVNNEIVELVKAYDESLLSALDGSRTHISP